MAGATPQGLTLAMVGVLPAAAIGILLSAAEAAWAGFGVLAIATLGCGIALRRARLAERREIERLGDRIDAVGKTAFLRRAGPATESVSPPDESGDPRDLGWLNRRLSLREQTLEPRLEFLILTRASLRAIVDGVDTPVFATDESGLVRLVNRAGERIFRRRSGRMTGEELEELFPQRPMQDLHDQAQAGEACRGKVRITIGESIRTFEVAAAPVRLDIQHLPVSGRPRAGVVLTLRDVTELARTVQLRTDFVANASHELRTPIASIRAAVETMRGVAPDDAGMRDRLVSMIENNVLRLEEMVADLLDLSNLESEQRALATRLVRTDEVCDALRNIFDGVCHERGLTLAFEIEPELRCLRTDPKLLMLILRNLVDNATKFAFEGTAVRVVGRRVDGEPVLDGPAREGNGAATPSIDVDADAADSQGDAGAEGGRAEPTPSAPGVRFSVIDRGEGIPLKHQERIFERFYQVSGSRTREGKKRGTGLGLAIVKHAAKRLGGDVSVESVWQEGTTMTVDLPGCVVEEEAALREDHAEMPDNAAHGGTEGPRGGGRQHDGEGDGPSSMPGGE